MDNFKDFDGEIDVDVDTDLDLDAVDLDNLTPEEIAELGLEDGVEFGMIDGDLEDLEFDDELIDEELDGIKLDEDFEDDIELDFEDWDE